jgi:hypothetical protein
MGSHFVWRDTPLGREIVITNLMRDGDVEATQQEIDEMYQKSSLIQRKSNILSELNSIDLRSIRALREGNAERLAQLEAEAEALRQQLNQ